MEIVDFYPKKFQEIPAQDNPAFGDEECFILVSEGESGHVVILHIDPDEIESVNRIAKFWNHKTAVCWCETVTSNAEITGRAAVRVD